MVRIAIHGAAGRMGRSVARVLMQEQHSQLVAAMDHPDSGAVGQDVGHLGGGDSVGVSVTADLEVFLRNVQVVIDFSTPEATERLLPVCAGQGVALVVGTTGLNEKGRAALERAAERVPLVFSPNYSQGVNALFYLAQHATRLLGASFDAEIVEKHHRHKVDAPSGTAIHLSRVVAGAKGLSADSVIVQNRSGRGERKNDEIGLVALRGGDVVGEHTLHLLGEGEQIELTHRATDRTIFARGAVRAAHWIASKPAGLYDMTDVLGIAR